MLEQPVVPKEARSPLELVDEIGVVGLRLSGALVKLREKASPIIIESTPRRAVYPAEETASSLALKLANLEYLFREIEADLENIIDSLDLRNKE